MVESYCMPDTVQTLHNIFFSFHSHSNSSVNSGDFQSGQGPRVGKEGGHLGTELVVPFSRFAILPEIPSLSFKGSSVWF